MWEIIFCSDFLFRLSQILGPGMSGPSIVALGHLDGPGCGWNFFCWLTVPRLEESGELFKNVPDIELKYCETLLR